MAMLVADRIERPPVLFGPGLGERERAAERRRGAGPGGGPTLDDAIVGVWEGLAARATVACPLCGGPLRSRPDGDAAAGGRCGDCGTTLT
jgi:hypothetical protein